MKNIACIVTALTLLPKPLQIGVALVLLGTALFRWYWHEIGARRYGPRIDAAADIDADRRRRRYAAELPPGATDPLPERQRHQQPVGRGEMAKGGRHR
jgi:hypothetical protein